MERFLGDEERIKRAEEIYYRRNNMPERIDGVEKKKFNISSFFLKTLIFINLSITIIMVQNRNYIFKEEFIKMITENVINIPYIRNIYITIQEKTNIKNDIETQNSNLYIENPIKILDENGKLLEDSSSINYERKIEAIQSKAEFVVPLDGKITITSGFGNRTSNYKNVSKYHTGIDFSANVGTIIKASTSGKVIEVSSKGDYGIHLKIQKEDIITLYAHCSEILVKEGDEIIQGQIIAKTGNTGNTTGPHLHFEIRKNGECLDPLEFIKI